MIFYLTARIVSSVAAFLYPGYASYKTLSQRPASEEELERWLMYWSVLGCLIGVEYLAEWLVSWIPFYYTLKMLFLLYLALPQTRGSSYIYTTHLQPFFHAHETQIDAALASLKARAYAFVQDRLRALWDAAAAAASLQQSQAGNQNPAGTTTGTAVPPSLADPVSGPAQLVGTLWRSYGPGIMASGAALLRTAATTVAPSTRPTGAAAAAGGAFNTPPSSVFRGNTGGNPSTIQSVLERRQQLEAELAALSSDAELAALQASSSSSGHLIPPASNNNNNNNNNNRRRGTDGVGLRERTYSNAGSGGSGRFEEVEVPSDVEGYDIGDAVVGEGHDMRAGTVTTAARGSWFGWGAGKGEYERVKSE